MTPSHKTAVNLVEIASPHPSIDVYRFVHAAESTGTSILKADLLSDAARGRRGYGRFAEGSVLLEGRSVFRTLELARDRWEAIATSARTDHPKVGDYIAELRLAPDLGFKYEDLGQADGHMTLLGDADALVLAVVAIHPARV